MKRLVVVYNPRSTKQVVMREQALGELRGLRGYLVGKYEVKKTSLEQNIRDLAGILMDEDLVLAVGGDGTAAMTMNAVLTSGKSTTLAELAYGNFNDLGAMIGIDGGVQEVVRKFEAGEVREVYPLEIRLDGEPWRYVLGYMTVGMLAASTAVFEEPKVRAKLKTGKTGRVFSIRTLAGWYFRNRHKEQILRDFELNGQKITKASDYLAINGPKVGGVMKGGEWYQEKGQFASGVGRLVRFWSLLKFMLRSMTKGLPVAKTRGDVLEFDEETEVMIQAEGEFEKVKVKKIEVRKQGEVKVVKK